MSSVAEGKVLKKATRFESLERRCKRNTESRPSPVMADIRLPIWLMKSHAEESSGPRVLIATGWKTLILIIIITTPLSLQVGRRYNNNTNNNNNTVK